MINTNQITKKQIKIIHTLKNRLGFDDMTYRTFLCFFSSNSATSSLELTKREAENIIAMLKREAIKRGIWQDYAEKRKYENVDGRKGMATGAQLRKIEAMWKEICRKKDEKTRMRMLRGLLLKNFKVSDLRFLERWQVRKVIKMLEAMR